MVKLHKLTGFKLIAIMPLAECHQTYLKVLKNSVVYKFYQQFNFYDEHGKTAEGNSVVEIKRDISSNSIHEDLYNIENINISVSAIVGKNGSGKSSLLELLFASMYSVALRVGILKSQNKPLSNLHVEIFYSIDNAIFCLSINSDIQKFTIFKYENDANNNNYKLCETWTNDKDRLHNFFYTISINYSIYGLNALRSEWVRGLFHKNDGYQTPVVINPYRDDGIIDINLEQFLAKQRLLSNILISSRILGKNQRYQITETQSIKSITFTLNRRKIEYAYKKENGEEVSFETLYETDPHDYILNSFYSIFCEQQTPKDGVPFRIEVERYIISKIIKIAMTYEKYRNNFFPNLENDITNRNESVNRKQKRFSHFEDFENYLQILKGDESHLTFKLRQAANYLIYGTLYDRGEKIYWQRIQEDYKTITDFLEIDAITLSKHIQQFESKSQSLISFIPPSIFDVEFSLTPNNSTFDLLSSGEQQQIHTIQSVLYHLLNLDSVFNNAYADTSYIKYENVNIVLDEVELCFHPEFQRNFVARLIDSLRVTPLPNIKSINILFSTHSPFILSDIPVQNILGLERGAVASFFDKETFGANIHDLLRNEFFLNKGFMGEFSKRKINETIDSLTKTKIKRQLIVWQKSEDKLNRLQYEVLEEQLSRLEGIRELSRKEVMDILNIIGEPVLKNSLAELINEVYRNSAN
jgi:hypothetical protein